VEVKGKALNKTNLTQRDNPKK